MQEPDVYEYAVVRYVPSIQREEFVNVGLIMMCKRRRWIRMALRPDWNKISAIGATHTPEELSCQLQGMLSIAQGNPLAGPIALLPPEERFRWLTAVKSASIQTSRPHPGLSTNLAATFSQLFDLLV